MENLYADTNYPGWDPEGQRFVDKQFQQLVAVREPANVPESERVPGRYYETRVNLTWRTLVANNISGT